MDTKLPLFEHILCLSACADNVPLHTFPNPEKEAERFRTWLYNVGGDILSLDNAFIYKRRKLCHHHFEERFHTWTNTLSRNAVPTLHLSDDVIQLTKGRPQLVLGSRAWTSFEDNMRPPMVRLLVCTSASASHTFLLCAESAACGFN
ncbi:hypothetical protein NE865_13993 [Phthorimaea operculella]|nr:hypothetical protein NE865_13993 [Phthorimaea operculella]